MKPPIGQLLFVIYIHESPEVCKKLSYFMVTLLKDKHVARSNDHTEFS